MLVRILNLLWVPFLCLSALAFETEAVLVEKDGSSRTIQLVAATKNSIRFRVADEAPVETKLTDGRSVFVLEPSDYTAAMDFYQAKKYLEAKLLFSAVKEQQVPVKSLEDSYATLAAFYEMECLRQAGDLDGLAAALQKFNYGPLTREYQLRQLELYVLWDAVRTRSWERLLSLAREWLKLRLPGEQRAQVAYCYGLALEGLLRTDKALLAFNTALTADAGASEVVTRLAALRILAIYHKDAEVQAAIASHGQTEAEAPSSGRIKLSEAVAVARIFEMTQGSGSPLPAEFREFFRYQKEP